MSNQPIYHKKPISPALGLEIRGLDLSKKLPVETSKELRQLCCDHSLLVIRGQELSENDQLRVAGYFGPVARRNRPPVEKRDYVPDPDNPVHLITNQLDATGKRLGSLRHGEMLFHSDGCYKPCPNRFTLLYGMKFPSSGGETRFASLYRPYEQLSENMLKKLTQCQVLFAYDFTLKDPIAPGSQIDDLMHARHPVLIKNPDTAKTAIYVNRLMTVQLEAMSSEESRETLEYLFQLMEAEDNVYTHRWLPGDLLIWDNLSSAHARNTWPIDEDRLLRRCVVEGEKLVASNE